MTEPPETPSAPDAPPTPPRPARSPEQQAKATRLAQALRDNLRRRKAVKPAKVGN